MEFLLGNICTVSARAFCSIDARLILGLKQCSLHCEKLRIVPSSVSRKPEILNHCLSRKYLSYTDSFDLTELQAATAAVSAMWLLEHFRNVNAINGRSCLT